MIYWNLFFAFLRVGMFAFGGAYGAIPMIRDIVLSYSWLTDEKLSYMIAVCESTPGPIMLNLATYIGEIRGGLLGAILSTFAVVLPSFVIILLITASLRTLIGNPWLKAVLKGIKPCIVGIVLSTGLVMVVSNCINVDGALHIDLPNMMISAFLILAALGYKTIRKKKMSQIVMILISGLLGIIFL